MVQVRALQPVNTDGSINLDSWLDHVLGMDPALDRAALKEACEFAREAEQQANAAQNLWSEGTSSYQTGLEIAEILADLKLDQDSLVAAVIYRGVREGKIQLAEVHQRFGPVVAKLIEGVLRMARSAPASTRVNRWCWVRRRRWRTCARCWWPWSTTCAWR